MIPQTVAVRWLKAHLHNHKAAQRKSKRRNPNNAIGEYGTPWPSSASLVPPHQPVQLWHPQLKGKERVPAHLTGVTVYRGMGFIMGSRGREFWDSTKLIMRCLEEDERPGKEGSEWFEEDQPLINTEEKKRAGYLKQIAGQDACLAMPCTDHCRLSCLLLRFHF